MSPSQQNPNDSEKGALEKWFEKQPDWFQNVIMITGLVMFIFFVMAFIQPDKFWATIDYLRRAQRVVAGDIPQWKLGILEFAWKLCWAGLFCFVAPLVVQLITGVVQARTEETRPRSSYELNDADMLTSAVWGYAIIFGALAFFGAFLIIAVLIELPDKILFFG